MTTLKNQVIGGVVWRTLEQFGTRGISVVVSIVLARILGPEEFGTVALLTIFLTLSSCLVNSGFSMALIQKKDVDDLDLNSVFYLNLAISLLIFGVLWICAPAIASFYGKPILVPVLRLSSVKLIIDAANGVQNVVLSRNMLFNRSFWISLSGIITNGVVGIWMAYTGFGLWALVWSFISGGLVATVVRWSLIGWRPTLQFSFTRLSSLFRFGSKMLWSSILETFSSQVYGLLIGKYYSAVDLAYFNRGANLPNLAMDSILGSISGVVFPALSKIQADKVRLKTAMQRILQTSSAVIFPLMFGLAAVAEPLIRLLYSDKWLMAVPYMQIACLGYALWPIHVANLQVIQAVGRGDIYLRLEIIKKVLIAVSILASFPYGAIALAFGKMLLSPISLYINCHPNTKLLDYSPSEQLLDVLPTFLLSVAMGVGVFSLSFFLDRPVVLLPLQILFGGVFYISAGLLLQIPGLQEVLVQGARISLHLYRQVFKRVGR